MTDKFTFRFGHLVALIAVGVLGFIMENWIALLIILMLSAAVSWFVTRAWNHSWRPADFEIKDSAGNPLALARQADKLAERNRAISYLAYSQIGRRRGAVKIAREAANGANKAEAMAIVLRGSQELQQHLDQLGGNSKGKNLTSLLNHCDRALEILNQIKALDFNNIVPNKYELYDKVTILKKVLPVILLSNDQEDYQASGQRPEELNVLRQILSYAETNGVSDEDLSAACDPSLPPLTLRQFKNRLKEISGNQR